MDLAERDRLIAVTKGFQGLQGLLYAPMGLTNVAMLLAMSLVHVNPASSERQLGAALAVLAPIPCGIAASFAAWWYYRRRFGVVRSKSPGTPSALLLIPAGIGALVAFFAASYVDGVGSYPVSLTCLWWGLLYVTFYLAPNRLRPHSLWFAALLLGLCFLTLMGVAPKSQFFAGSGHAGDILIWFAFSVHGLLDHLRLLRLLPKVSSEQATSQSTVLSGERHD